MMIASTRATAALLGCLALAGLASPASLTGQAPDQAPVFLALPETFPDVDARAVLLRERGREIVVLDPDDAEQVESLRVALLVLRRIRGVRPAPEGRGQMIPITGYVLREELSTELREELESALSDLRRHPVANVGNLGPGRWMPFRQP